MTKFELLLSKILNSYSFTVYDNKNKLLTFTPMSDWEIKLENKSSAKLKVKNGNSKTNYYIELFNMFTKNDLLVYISSEGRTYTCKSYNCPNDSILTLNSSRLFNKILELIKPGDFAEYLEIFDKDEDKLDNFSDEFLSLVFVDFLLKESFFDAYINKKTFITHNNLLKKLSSEYIYKYGFTIPNDTKINEFEEMISDICSEYAESISYIISIDNFDDLKDFNETIDILNKLFTAKIVDTWKSSIEVDETFKKIIDNPEKYKVFLLSQDELIDLYDKTNKHSYEIDDNYHGGAFYLKLTNITNSSMIIEYTFSISVIIDPYSGKEYTDYETAHDGSITICSFPDGKIKEGNSDLRDDLLHQLTMDIIIEELIKKDFKFL